MPEPSFLPEYVTRLKPDETFTFSCHRGVKCFTECCRMLELALSPYDILRLRKATGLRSEQLLDRYVIVEHEPEEPFPRFYLTMVDDGRASCVFVADKGCTVYQHRPAACRTYPLGRASTRLEDGGIKEHFVLMKEKHCLGFLEPDVQDAKRYSVDQDLHSYNRFNDAVAKILQHDAIRKGYLPTAEQLEMFTLALYNLDSFRDMVEGDMLGSLSISTIDRKRLQNDEELLLFAIDWVLQQLFPPR
ncbi:MAG: YkgJ family cysteine cluster protein [Desulforhopalus sp.]